MKNKILSLLASLALIVLFSACDDHKYGSEPDSYGKLSFANFDISVDQSKSDAESRAVQTVDVSNYIVTITKKGAKQPTINKTFGQLPGVVDLAVGEYTIKVESHKVVKAAFDAPYYLGTQDIKIEEDKVCDAGTIICKFASVGVQVTFSEALIPMLGDDVVVTVNSTGGAKLEYKKDETRTGYFEYIGSSTLIVNVTGTINGQSVNQEEPIRDVEVGKIFVVRIKINTPEKPGETGAISPGEGVKIDTSVIESDDNNIGGNVNVGEEIINDPNRPGQEDPGTTTPPDDPTPPTPPVSDGDVTMTSELEFNTQIPTDTDKSGVVDIHADSGLAHLYLTVISNSEDFTATISGLFGDGEFDLANPPSEKIATIKRFQLACGDEVLNKEDVKFDITMFISMLSGFLGPDDTPGIHEFKLRAVSNSGSELTKSLIFIAK